MFAKPTSSTSPNVRAKTDGSGSSAAAAAAAVASLSNADPMSCIARSYIPPRR